ncbi:dGTP triphosphohydrolase [Tepidibacter sp. Z1-5]|uniref:dGTP triphosphohydrolase n=1 Tax=Tepidibacter sp. Z1-5 TaxID=3134138 RepID=UPI0030C4FB8E
MEDVKQLNDTFMQGENKSDDNTNRKYEGIDTNKGILDDEMKEKIKTTRTEFSRDRDRILFCKAFRRLEHKAQIYSHEKGDHFRTRLTHSLEVSQIGRSLAINLGLNEVLVEAISLGHDLGHTPFGHQGERTLDKIMSGEDDLSKKLNYKIDFGGFKHNFNSLRILDQIEKKYENVKGLNLTWQVLEGILKHTKVKRHKKEECIDCNKCWNIDRFIDFEGNKEFEKLLNKKFRNLLYLDERDSVTLEGQIVALADEIAQRQHDLDDGLRDSSLNLSYEEVIKFIKNAADKKIEEYNNIVTKLKGEKFDKEIDIENINKKAENINKKAEKLKKKYEKFIKEELEYKLIEKLELDTKLIEKLKEKLIKLDKKEENIEVEKNIEVEENISEEEILYMKINLVRDIIDYFILDATNHSRFILNNIEKDDFKNEERNEYIFKKKIISFSDIAEEFNDKVDKYISNRIVNSFEVNRFDGKAIYIIRQLFKAYHTNPRQMPTYVLERMQERIKKNCEKYYDIKIKPKDKAISISEIKFKSSSREELNILIDILKLNLNFNKLICPQCFATNENFFVKDALNEEKISMINKCNSKLNSEHEEFLKCLIENNYVYLSSICDYIAGMTDNFAKSEYNKLY